MVDDQWKYGVKGDARFYLDLLTHDIKNLNQGVHGYLELMTMMPDTTEKQRKFLEEALSYVRISSNLINSIELDSKVRSTGQSIGLLKAVTDSKTYFESLNSNMDLQIKVEGLSQNIVVRGNLLLVDAFLFLLDYMMKRSVNGKLRVNIKVKENLDNSVQVRFLGDFDPPDRSTMKTLFRDSDPVMGAKKGKLVLCRSIVERFGGTINYYEPITSSGFCGGGFNVVLREVVQ